MIALEDTKDKTFYIIKARNAFIGFYNKEDSSFDILRTKFGRTSLSKEYHWDTGAPYGSAKPLKELKTNTSFNTEEGDLRLELLRLGDYYKELYHRLLKEYFKVPETTQDKLLTFL